MSKEATTRVCSKCHTEKPLTDFHRSKNQPLGRAYYCKVCLRAQHKDWVKKTPEYKATLRTPAYRAKLKSKGIYTYAHRRQWLIAYEKRHPDHVKARVAVKEAVKNGSLVKERCEECHDPNVHAHHYKGYAKENWLAVQWLCNKHHSEKHHG